METTKYENQIRPDETQRPRRPGGKVFAGFIVLTVGVVLLLNQMGFAIPHWIITWPMILIAVGLFIGAKRGFKGTGWFIFILIGSAFLLQEVYPALFLQEYIWPVLLIIIGLLIIFGPRRAHRPCRGSRWRHHRRNEAGDSAATSPDDYVTATTIFSAQEKRMVSKDFKGGEITTFFGGSSLDFSQADIKGTALLGITQVFGGLELVVPPHWAVQSEVSTIFGGLEDNRSLHGTTKPDPTKRLILKGSVIFGGIEIKSFQQ